MHKGSHLPSDGRYSLRLSDLVHSSGMLKGYARVGAAIPQCVVDTRRIQKA